MRPRAGSLVLRYEGSTENEILDGLQRMFSIRRAPDRLSGTDRAGPARQTTGGRKEFAKAIPEMFVDINRAVEKVTGGVDLRILVPVALLGFSILGMMAAAIRDRKLPTPTWYDLLWFAFNTFVILNLTLTHEADPKPASETETEITPESG
jgi:hypothetical protein